jgi:hypothetical protein
LLAAENVPIQIEVVSILHVAVENDAECLGEDEKTAAAE